MKSNTITQASWGKKFLNAIETISTEYACSWCTHKKLKKLNHLTYTALKEWIRVLFWYNASTSDDMDYCFSYWASRPVDSFFYWKVYRSTITIFNFLQFFLPLFCSNFYEIVKFKIFISLNSHKKIIFRCNFSKCKWDWFDFQCILFKRCTMIFYQCQKCNSATCTHCQPPLCKRNQYSHTMCWWSLHVVEHGSSSWCCWLRWAQYRFSL